MKRLVLVAAAMLLMAGPALAAAPGDVVRSALFGPYLLENQSSRLYIPDQMTLETWGNQTVNQIDPSVLSQWALSGTVPIRQGSKLVKFDSDPRIYAVGPHATLHWISTEKLASELYGDDWNRHVVTLFSSYYANYTEGESIMTAKHPDGTLLKYADDGTIYSIVNGKARPFADSAAFTENGFDASSVVTVPRTFVYDQSGPITGWERDLSLQSSSL